MNKKCDISRSEVSKRAGSRSAAAPGARDATNRGAARRGGSASRLAAEERRLLAALAKPSASAFADPTDETAIILRQQGPAVSVSAGRFARVHSDALARRDLACWIVEGQPVLRITEAGRAHLRREQSGDAQTAFFDQHRETRTLRVETRAGTKQVRIDMDESPLDWLRRRKDRDGQRLIGEAAYEAGERLRRDIVQAGWLPGVTARWDAMPTGGRGASPSEATDRMVAARQRIRHAFDAIGGDFSDLLVDLCGFLKGLELIERERQWPARSAKVVIRLALARLAEHYGIETSARGPASSRGIRAWQAVVIEGGLRGLAPRGGDHA